MLESGAAFTKVVLAGPLADLLVFISFFKFERGLGASMGELLHLLFHHGFHHGALFGRHLGEHRLHLFFCLVDDAAEFFEVSFGHLDVGMFFGIEGPKNFFIATEDNGAGEGCSG